MSLLFCGNRKTGRRGRHEEEKLEEKKQINQFCSLKDRSLTSAEQTDVMNKRRRNMRRENNAHVWGNPERSVS